jgi:hypothetical protein
MKKFIVVGTILLSSLAYANSASAAYDPSGDIKVNVNILKDQIVLSDKTGEFTFTLQENLHSVLKSTTGLELNHSYAWININGFKILAIDPPKPCF